MIALRPGSAGRVLARIGCHGAAARLVAAALTSSRRTLHPASRNAQRHHDRLLRPAIAPDRHPDHSRRSLSVKVANPEIRNGCRAVTHGGSRYGLVVFLRTAGVPGLALPARSCPTPRQKIPLVPALSGDAPDQRPFVACHETRNMDPPEGKQWLFTG